MCANYKPITLQQIAELGLPEIPFAYPEEVFPLFLTPLLFESEQGLEWRLVNFGLVPKWATDLDIAKRTYNARNETLHEKRSFHEALEKFKFGVIPVTEFYEAKYVRGKAQRWGVRRKDGKAFYIAALYEITKIQDQVIRSATMLTMNAIDHEMMKEFHEPGDVKRSVIIIPDYRLLEWLSLKSVDIQTFVQGFPVNEFECFYCPKTKLSKDSPQLNIFDSL
ncbi:SOS response-associated peptidase family protein [Acinetobacter shaoyimingii]|uniref:Abasic site processing protein n=1 Tax=Acinetobacter shaoyimingii TaxID=2715164 RepID=A0A6G8RUS6_9GAMM|nr:SOS response-associated peptidase family protein [Acinetobacter shaoyimingii]NHB58581.1 SOS response-associated peptidase [Acinetobacter shaoyimingii]QIO05692.1 SOS response-associated peptidase [Acinetobacter shaoyimingii]